MPLATSLRTYIHIMYIIYIYIRSRILMRNFFNRPRYVIFYKRPGAWGKDFVAHIHVRSINIQNKYNKNSNTIIHSRYIYIKFYVPKHTHGILMRNYLSVAYT